MVDSFGGNGSKVAKFRAWGLRFLDTQDTGTLRLASRFGHRLPCASGLEPCVVGGCAPWRNVKDTTVCCDVFLSPCWGLPAFYMLSRKGFTTLNFRKRETTLLQETLLRKLNVLQTPDSRTPSTPICHPSTHSYHARLWG